MSAAFAWAASPRTGRGAELYAAACAADEAAVLAERGKDWLRRYGTALRPSSLLNSLMDTAIACMFEGRPDGARYWARCAARHAMTCLESAGAPYRETERGDILADRAAAEAELACRVTPGPCKANARPKRSRRVRVGQ